MGGASASASASASQRVMMMMLIIIIIILQSSCGGEGCLEQERSALLHLKHFFDTPYRLRDWVVDDGDDKNYYSDCCQWERVECSNTTGRIISLYIWRTRKSTKKWYLNASLFTPFQQLEHLDLEDNNIAGCVENEGLEKLSGLTNLTYLYLSFNYFNNSILPSLAGLSSLTGLSLSNNSLKGNIDVKGLSKLEYLDLSGNNFNLNFSLTGLPSLTTLSLRSIGFKGSFDFQGLDSLSNLEQLYLSFNEIDNLVVPKGLSKLKYLDLSSNNINLNFSLTGLPSLTTLLLRSIGFKGSFDFQDLESLSNLEELDLSYNEIDNLVVPKACKVLRKLRSLNLSGNKIKDARETLQSLGSFPSLNALRLSDNNFTIATALGLCELVHLQELYIDHNDLRGNLPGCLPNMTSLRVLDVSFNQLTGNISSSPLMNLTSIEELFLSNNQFHIPISLEPFFNFSKLKVFEGRSNELYAEPVSHSLAPKFQLNTIELSGGAFPKFLYHQHELKYVYLSGVNLSGEFPNWLLENNTNLNELDLSNNSLSGPFHMPIHSHKKLLELDISNNLFQGIIPTKIGAYLPSLRVLILSRNAFNGSVPSSFGDMKSLLLLDLSNNQLAGEIPEHLTMSCFNLETLLLSNNSLQGHIFSKNFNLTKLWRLNLDGNNFTGEIHESLSKCLRLRELYLSDNNFFGKIPKWLGNLSSLFDIAMSNNHLEGPIPVEFCQLNFLQILDLSKNNISGSLPSCFGLYSLKRVHLSKNKLQGLLKDGTFYNSSSLVTLDLSYNRLNGNIPTWIEKLTQLRYFILANNNIEGEVSAQLCQLKQLRLIDFSHNKFSGQIPPCLYHTSLHEGYYDASAPTFIPPRPNLFIFGYALGNEETITFTTKEISYSYKGKPLNSMYGIDLSCNKLTGEIPPQIGELTRIHTLNLSHNNLTGTIPVTFSSLKQVESLDLSYNNLNGKIPAQLVELTFLTFFNVAHNNLSGRIPEWTAQFATFNESSYQGNPFLCGPPLLKNCNENGSSPSGVPEASVDNEEDGCLIDMDIFYITFIVSYVIVILGIIGVLWVNSYWRRRWFYLIEMWMTSCYYFILDNIIPTRFCLGCM